MWLKWEDLPAEMRCHEVYPYYEMIKQKRWSLILKRLFDVCGALIGLILLSPVLLVLGLWIKIDSPGGALFVQERVTQYGRKFKIHKFRTMVPHAESLGTQVTVAEDPRITGIGKFLRKYRLDELPQLYDILVGNMSFVGTRPETPRYVQQYTPEMYATLLLPAGVTSEASIRYKDEDTLLKNAADPDWVYINQVLPEKMKYNLESLRHFGFCREFKTLIKTFWAVLD